MSKVTKRKHVMKEMDLDNFEHPLENQQIVRICSSRGNNLHEVESADDSVTEHFLVSMPTKFRKNVWVKRGDFVLVEAIEEGDKVKAEIVRILTPQHIKEFKKDGIWPKKFTDPTETAAKATGSSDSDRDSDDDDDLVQNTNRHHQHVEEDSDSEDSDSDNNSGNDQSSTDGEDEE